MRVVFDLETDGLLPELTKIHCIGLKYISSELFYEDTELRFTPTGKLEALAALEKADEIIGHNIIAFDIPAIKKIYPEFSPKGKITDTLVLSRLIKPNLSEDDRLVMFNKPFPKSLYGSHSLTAWGLRLGNLKGDYNGGWEKFSVEMADYCKQDVNVTTQLYELLMQANFDPRCVELEHDLAEICDRIGNAGWTFDSKKAGELYAQFCQRRSTLSMQLGELFEPWQEEEEFIPKRDNKTRGYKKGVPFIKKTTVHFNPNSRQHIAHCLKTKYKWKPKELTPTGEAKIDESTLGELPYPEAGKLAEMFLLQKRIGMLAEGSNAWMKLVNGDTRLRHQIISGGTVSGRAAHRNPNLGQVPGLQSPYGKECRELFTVPQGWVLLGADLSGLELRCLAHYLSAWDNGDYANEIMSGDIHTKNQHAAGLPSRAEAKTFIYALLYGGGNRLIGDIVGKSSVVGAKLKRNFEQAIPAYKKLQEKLGSTLRDRGHIRGLDGRKLTVRSEHKALSQLLQSAGAILCKQWVKLIDDCLDPKDAYIVGWIHDEVQIAIRNKELAEHVGNQSERVAQEAGRAFNLKIPIEAEWKIGQTWADTH